MSAEDKAKELMNKLSPYSNDMDFGDTSSTRESAIIVCDEVLSTFSHHMTTKIKYWQAVKTAITKL